LMFWGLFTHPILDSFTTWGTQLFWPFETRLAFQNIFVIDPLYTLPFLVFLVLAMCQKRDSKKRRRYNNLGLFVSSFYMLITLILKGISYNSFTNALVAQEIEYIKIDTRPSPFNTILWSANIETEDAYLIANYSFFDTQPINFSRYPKNHTMLGDLQSHTKVQRLITICENWYTISKKEDRLYFNDLRFGLMSMNPNEKQFAFSYELRQQSGTLVVVENKRVGADAQKLLAALWKRIWGN